MSFQFFSRKKIEVTTNLFDDFCFDFGMPRLVKAKLFPSCRAQIQHTLLGEGASVIDANNDTLPVALACDFKLCAKRQTSMSASKGILVENLTTSRFLTIKPRAIIAGITRKFRSHSNFLFRGKSFCRTGTSIVTRTGGNASLTRAARRKSHRGKHRDNKEKSARKAFHITQSRTCYCTNFLELRLPCS